MVTPLKPTQITLETLPEVPGAYVMLHKLSKQCFVGSTGNLRCRLQLHTEALDRGEHSCAGLQLAHDLDTQFEFSVIPTADRQSAGLQETELRRKYVDGRLFNHEGPTDHYL